MDVRDRVLYVFTVLIIALKEITRRVAPTWNENKKETSFKKIRQKKWNIYMDSPYLDSWRYRIGVIYINIVSLVVTVPLRASRKRLIISGTALGNQNVFIDPETNNSR